MTTQTTGWSVGLEVEQPDQLIHEIEVGFAGSAVNRFRKRLGLSLDEIASFLRISPRTLMRRQKRGRLTPAESDLLYRIARLYERAVEVLGSEESARRWMKRPQWALGDATPLRYAMTEPGAREVERLLGRIEHSVLS